MKNLFWRLAFKLYSARQPSIKFEVFTIGFGSFMVAMYAVAVCLNPTFPNSMRLFVAAIFVILGLAHRRVRLERQKGPNALYRKVLAKGDESSPFQK